MLERKGTERKGEDKVSEWQLLAGLLSCLLADDDDDDGGGDRGRKGKNKGTH